MSKDAQAGQAFKNIALRITGEKVPFVELGKNDQGFFSNVFKKFFNKK